MSDLLNDLLTNAPLWGALLGVLTPLGTAIVQQPEWTKRTRTLVGVVASVVVGLATVGAAGDLGDGTTLAATLAAVVAAAKVAYDKFGPVRRTAEKIEHATSPVGDYDDYDPAV